MSKKVIIAGGGTGGHIFPAIAIANALRKLDKEIEVLFVGAKGRMEMEKVPQAGYKIEGLSIAGFNRSSLIKNIGLPYKLLKSFLQVRSIFKRFRPQAAIGVGGYSSFPVLRFAQAQGVKTFIHESNSYAGRANMMLARKVTRVFTGTDGMEKFFPKQKIIVTGNPIRSSITTNDTSREQAIRSFGLEVDRPILLVVGGSLGAKSINDAIHAGIEKLLTAGIQLIWQTGKPYVQTATAITAGKTGVWSGDFIREMNEAYSAADIVVARSGAMTVAELSVVGKPVIFVPYPFAAEDHQTVNAMRLVSAAAALMIKDYDSAKELVPTIISLAHDKERRIKLEENIKTFGVIDADTKIAEEILRAMQSL